MIKKSSSLIFGSVLIWALSPLIAKSEVSGATRGYLSTKLSSYTDNPSANYGNYSRGQIERSTEFSNSIIVLNQLRFTSNSYAEDLSSKSTPPKKELYEVVLGENYLKIKEESWVTQIGYQDVVWGEAFGLNYADIINPKDQKLTFYDDSAEARLPLLMLNGKKFFSIGDLSGSLQVIYSPESRFSKSLPIDLLAGNLFPQNKLNITKENIPSIFKNSEWGEKLSTSFNGFDTSLFHFNYLDRNPYYNLKSISLTEIDLQEAHNKISSSGLSFAKTIFDFVLRSDIVYTEDQTINYLESSILKSYQTKVLDTLVSLDTPSFNDYSAILIVARSSLSNFHSYSFRNKNQDYSIIKLSKNFGNDKTVDLSYTHEFNNSGHGIQTLYKWPITNQTDLKFGGEFYFGNENSSLKKLKQSSNVFVSIKNYFQL